MLVLARAGPPPVEAVTTWDPAACSSFVGLSSGNLVASRLPGHTGNYSMVFSTTAHTTGKWYYETTITHDSDANTGWAIGMSIAGTVLDGSSGSDFPGVQPGTMGGLANNVGTSYFAVASLNITQDPGWSQVNNPAHGDVIGIAVDFTVGRLWYQDWTRANGWNVGTSGAQDPGAGLGGVNIAGQMGTPKFIKWGGYNNGNPVAVCTLNTGGSPFAGTMPPGFVIWG